MKLIVVLALVAVTAAQEARYVEGSDRNAEIIRNDFQMDDAGNFQADVETSNSILQSSSGISRPGPEQETGSYEMTGQYQYETPNGQLVTVTWTAGPAGYQAESDYIPRLSPEHQAIIDASISGLPQTYSEQGSF